jgi:hypothetical protein
MESIFDGLFGEGVRSSEFDEPEESDRILIERGATK